MLIVLIGVLAGTLVGVAVIVASAGRAGVVPMPSSPSVRRLVVDILRDYDEIRTITDLGSGWGGLARRVARALRDREVIAVECSRIPLLVSRIVAGVSVLGNLRHDRADIHTIRLSGGNAYICYLSGPSMRRLRERFERDLPRGGVLLSAAFAMPGWTPTRVERAADLFRSPVYVYEF